jgi:succinate dehydrogenase/fumarate reductase flavoprotein subunit
MSAGTGETGAGALIWAATSGARGGTFAAQSCAGRARLLPQPTKVAAARERTLKPLGRPNGLDPQRVVVNTQEVICPGNMLIIKNADRLNIGVQVLERIRLHEVPYMRARDPHELRMAHEAEASTHRFSLRSSLAESRSELRKTSRTWITLTG